MKRLETPAQLAAWRAEVGAGGSTALGLVATMGALHEGHLSLVRRAAAENDATLATVFVNPAQFDREDDLAAYPRDLERDAALLADAGCDALFAPSVDAIYPQGFDTWVIVGGGPLAEALEGRARPGHFRGVATVVLKLLVLTAPQRAYFGQKDAQQLAVVRKLARDLALPVEIVACATVREADGLAMSSRNRLLTPVQRQAARNVYGALRAGETLWRGGVRDGERLRRAMRGVLDGEPQAAVDYASVVDPESFRELGRLDGGAPPLLLVAARFGAVRLIDNLQLQPVADRAPAPLRG